MSKDDLSMGVLFPSQFLAAADLGGGEATVKIFNVVRDDVPMSGGKKEKATILSFEGTSKAMICNKTNGFALALLLSPGGKQPSGRDWIGKRIVLRADIDSFGRETVAAIRVVGSPDATPDRAATFERIWTNGNRTGGDLCRRLKRQVGINITREVGAANGKGDAGAAQGPNPDGDGR